MKIAIVIPAYNEAITIAAVIGDFYQQRPEAEIWVVDNRSSDDTAAIAESALRKLGAKGGVLYEPQRGKANACRTAFRLLDADIFVMVDADRTYPADALNELLSPIIQGRADMVVGDRLTSGSYSAAQPRPFHSFGNSLVCGLLSLFFGTRIRDAMSGYRAFSREFIKLFPVLESGFELETEMSIHAVSYGYRIQEIPVAYLERPPGSSSKLNTVADGFRILKLIVRLLKNNRPRLFFGLLALMFGVAGVAMGIPALGEFMRSGQVEQVALGLLGAGLCAIGLLLALVGIVMDTVTSFHQFEFEIQRNLFHAEVGRSEKNGGTQDRRRGGTDSSGDHARSDG